jgi:hypothetical protein
MAKRKSDKFIPNGDGEFAYMALNFARNIARDAARFSLSSNDAEEISRAVAEFREGLAVALRKSTRTQVTIMRKDELRQKAERVVREYGNVIRANRAIDPIDKMRIGVKERPARLKERSCPQTRPLLSFIRSTGESGSTGGQHVLRFGEGIDPRTLKMRAPTRAKPPGVARIELFVELVPEGEPTPSHPGEMSGGRLWYLGSFSRNPIEVAFPVPATSMLVVYWARWAGANNDVGPFSRTCVARQEGGFAAAGALPDQRLTQNRRTKCVVTILQRPQHCLEQIDADALLLAGETARVEPAVAQVPKQLPAAA